MADPIVRCGVRGRIIGPLAFAVLLVALTALRVATSQPAGAAVLAALAAVTIWRIATMGLEIRDAALVIRTPLRTRRLTIPVGGTAHSSATGYLRLDVPRGRPFVVRSISSHRMGRFTDDEVATLLTGAGVDASAIRTRR